MGFWSDFTGMLPLHQWLDPEKRVFWPFLLLSGLYALIYLVFTNFNGFFKKLKGVLGSSSRVDVGLWVLNYLIQALLLPVSFGNGLLFAVHFRRFCEWMMGPMLTPWTIDYWVLAGYALALIVIMDFARFLLHYLMHKVEILQPIHMIHHHAEVLTPITLFRVHPLEMLLSQVRYLVVYGMVTGFFLYLTEDVVTMPKVLGVSVGVFVSNILAANLRHSNIPISFGILERIFISPKQHQMHHARNLDHEVQNLGSLFSVWDSIFGTWRSSRSVNIDGFGSATPVSQSLWQEILYPFECWLGKWTSPKKVLHP